MQEKSASITDNEDSLAPANYSVIQVLPSMLKYTWYVPLVTVYSIVGPE